jgi:hypothetical protein
LEEDVMQEQRVFPEEPRPVTVEEWAAEEDGWEERFWRAASFP